LAAAEAFAHMKAVTSPVDSGMSVTDWTPMACGPLNGAGGVNCPTRVVPPVVASNFTSEKPVGVLVALWNAARM
jgi:hypothetical protein